MKKKRKKERIGHKESLQEGPTPHVRADHLMLFSLPLFSIAAMHELTKMGTEVFCLSHRCPIWQPNTLSESLIEKCYSILKNILCYVL